MFKASLATTTKAQMKNEKLYRNGYG